MATPVERRSPGKMAAGCSLKTGSRLTCFHVGPLYDYEDFDNGYDGDYDDVCDDDEANDGDDGDDGVRTEYLRNEYL